MIHLFYLGSNSHIIIADGIIRARHLPLDSVFFVTYRGIKLPPVYSKRLLIDESVISNRKKYFIRHYSEYNSIVRHKHICAYLPFQGQFPVYRFFDEYVFFEEGLSAYDTTLDYSIFKRKNYFKLLIKWGFFSLFFSKNMWGLFNGRQNGSPFPFNCTLVGLTDKSYRNVCLDCCRREVLQLPKDPLVHSSIADSVIIVMDSTHATDRMESAENYLRILADALRMCSFQSRRICLKLHPDNYKDKEQTVAFIKQFINFIDFNVIDESLEDIALSNNNNIFFGNHSTILFYAPIFGNTNRSVSFVRINAERDSTYVGFLQRWGGVDKSISLFKQHVECI